MAIGVIGLLVHALLAVRAGLLLIAIGIAAGAAWRMLAWASLGKRPPFYGVIAIGLRIAAALSVLGIAISVHF